MKHCEKVSKTLCIAQIARWKWTHMIQFIWTPRKYKKVICNVQEQTNGCLRLRVSGKKISFWKVRLGPSRTPAQEFESKEVVWWWKGSWELSHACDDMLTVCKSSKMMPKQYHILAVSIAWHCLCQHWPEFPWFSMPLLDLILNRSNWRYSSSSHKFIFCWSYLESASVALKKKNPDWNRLLGAE